MKKANAFVCAVFAALFFFSCSDALVDDGTHVKKYTGGLGAGGGLYLKADGYELGPWGCWDNDGDVATLTNGAEGGLHVVPNRRDCGSTYLGVNLAAGTKVGENADLDGSMFTKVVFNFRGNIDASLISFYALNGDKSKKCGDITGTDTNGNDVFKMLDAYNTGYNEETWTEIIVNLPNSTDKMTSALILSVGNDSKWSPEKWVEIKDIDWQDDKGNSVIPKYVN